MTEEEKWKNRLLRERAARAQAEQLLEEKSAKLYETNLQLEQANAQLADDYHAAATRSARQGKTLQALFDSSIDGIILTDEDGCITQVNQALCNLLKQQESDLLYRPLWALMTPPDGDPDFICKVRKQLHENGFVRFQCTLQNSYGVNLPCAFGVNQLHVEGESILQAIVRDVTEQREAAAALEKATQDAIEANQAKSMFLATMSHEIRTPLNGVIGFTDLLLQEDLTEEQSTHLQMIKKSGSLLLSIINDILDFSKIESNQIELEEIDFSLRECITSTLELHAQQANAKGIQLLHKIAPDVPLTMRGDMGRLQQILLNLVSNSLKFTDNGSILINALRASHNFIEIQVTDTGIGFEQELAEKLFAPFSQADASTTRKYGGTGLGLPICRELIELMGGSIHPHATPGKGATFKVLFPYQPALTTSVGRSNHPALAPSAHQASTAPEAPSPLALLVEDNPINAKLAKILLQRMGLTVHIAHNGQEALDALRENPSYHLLFMDMQMPVMDGIEATKAIRAGAAGTHYQATPIIAMTANATREDEIQCLTAGMNHFITKPINQSTLRDYLTEISIIR